MTRELVFPGPKSRSASSGHLAHFIYSTNMVHRFVETTYNLELGPAQVTQLNKAISNGADKGTFYLPKGMLINSSIRCPLTFSVKVFLDALSSLRRLLRRIATLTPKR